MSNFKGFPKEFITFFENLKQNNSKDWFEKHRKDYEELVLHPAGEFYVINTPMAEESAP